MKLEDALVLILLIAFLCALIFIVYEIIYYALSGSPCLAYLLQELSIRIAC
jgi:hypothetical protein